MSQRMMQSVKTPSYSAAVLTRATRSVRSKELRQIVEISADRPSRSWRSLGSPPATRSNGHFVPTRRSYTLSPLESGSPHNLEY
ncbi:hypothetical protein Bcep1808_4355 [Burkholderia vietnamiensis G4]|uniref:Uncharacterized protein n=1 Tax=Burkholderia vietnamiensis (strain G4 / LMG 22486) TaxID=269482 RepID=A4JM21_BURVG|nr:hypothetical protein Bcep1808_4355 [Burkholderia vietnamiensis G4]